jgi:hypothetical protein
VVAYSFAVTFADPLHSSSKTSIRPVQIFGVCLLVALTSCSYDLDAIGIRGRDAGVDRATPPPDLVVSDVTPPDVTVTDIAQMDMVAVDVIASDVQFHDVRAELMPDVVSVDVQPDVMFADVGLDVVLADTGPDVMTRPPSTGVCDLPGVATLAADPSGTTLFEGNTMSASANLPLPMCQRDVAMTSTRIYRYVVGAGNRIVATTNTSRCGGHDTILAVYSSCSAAGVGVLADRDGCNDDDAINLCASCAAASSRGASLGCGTVFSTVTIGDLIPNDVLYFVVSSFGGTSTSATGPFRLSIAENGLRTRALEAVPSLVVAPMCSCPMSPATVGRTVLSFPTSTDTGTLATTPRTLTGTRPLPYSRLAGMSAKIYLRSATVSSDPACRVPIGSLVSALDVVVGTSIIASVTVDSTVLNTPFFTIPYIGTVVTGLTASALATLRYQLRPLTPSTTQCFNLDIDQTAPNTLVIYGSN